MERFIAIWTTAFIFFAMTPAGAADGVNIELNGEWEFTYTGSSTSEVPEPPPESAYDSKILVPGRWDDQLERFKNAKWRPQAIFRSSLGPVQYLSGVGWHRKLIDAPSDWKNRAALLTIGHAVGTTHVWLNGKHLGSNQLGVYTPFSVDLTNQFKPGEKNELVIAVDNASPNILGGWAFLGNAGMASGLARPVTLRVAAGPGRIADLYVRPGEDLKEIVWELDLMLPESDEENTPSKIQWFVTEPKSGRKLAQGEVAVSAFSKSQQVTWKERLEDIKPWSDREPNLYTMEVRWITSDGHLLDLQRQRFGLRRWSYEGRRLFLNGNPYYARAEFGAYYFPLDGAVSTSKEYWVSHMKRLKELGLNGINFAAQVCPIEMMEAADELGVVLQCGDQVTTRPEGKQRYREVWNSIVRTTRRYPSMAIYGFGGELKYYEGVIEQNKLQMDLIKSLHPESLVMPQQAIHGIDYGIEDPRAPGVKRKPFLHHAERLARYTEACDLFGHYSGGAFSHSYFSTPWRDMEKRFQVYQKPLLAHELFISASYLNPDNMEKYTGRIPPYIYTRLQHDLEEAGLIDKWKTYFDHTSRLQHICRKYCMEKARKCDGLAGFELLGMMDMHFITPEYAVGIVDEFLNMKPGDTSAGIRKYNDESVLLLDFDNGEGLNRCYWEGDAFTSEVMASLYGPEPLKKGTLNWKLTDGKKTLLKGKVDVADVPHGAVTALNTLRFDWPAVKKTTRLNLSVELSGSGYSLANDWDFWAFPKDMPPQVEADVDQKWLAALQDRYKGIQPITNQSGEKLRLVSKLEAADVDHLASGGDVVLLGTAPFTQYTRWPSFYPAKGMRPFSNGGTIIAKHPIFEGHPNEGWNDWHFFPLMQGANSVLFDGSIDAPFDPILELISSAGHVRKQALIFEYRVGKGRLLVATTVFDLANASCATLLDSILRYVAGPEFQPSHSIEASELDRATSPPKAAANKLVDPSFEKSGHWMTEGGSYELDDSTAHTGDRSLKLTVTADDLQQNRHFSSGVSYRQIGFNRQPRQLQLSAWFKTDAIDDAAVPKVLVTFRYEDAHIRSSSFFVSLPEPTDEWRYVEKTIDLDGKITVANVYIDLTGAAGTAWVDDIYFGEPRPEAPAAVDSARETQNVTKANWRNEAFTRSFGSPIWYRIDEGEWVRGSTLAIDREGIHTVVVKKTVGDSAPQTQQVHIDLSPPVVSLETEPDLLQEAGIFTTGVETAFKISARDDLSGIDAIEVATDGRTYAPYTKPFKLSAGRHVIKCRATDLAGNRSSSITGEWITGSNEDFLEVEVLSNEDRAAAD